MEGGTESVNLRAPAFDQSENGLSLHVTGGWTTMEHTMPDVDARGLRSFAFLLLILLAASLVATFILGTSSIAALLARLGLLPASSLNADTIGQLSILWFCGGLLVLIVGLVLLLARNIARKGAWLFASGLALLIVGSGPIFLVGLAAQLGLTADPNPNPVFLGILAFLTVLPAMLLAVAGVIVFTVGKVWRV